MKLFVAVIALALVGFALQSPQPIPPFEGDGDHNHDGQPAHCQNFDNQWLHNCECQPQDPSDDKCKDPDRGGENAYCKVYCRKNACACRRGCERTR